MDGARLAGSRRKKTHLILISPLGPPPPDLKMALIVLLLPELILGLGI